MMYLGDYAEDSTLDFIWSSNDGSGASVTRATNGTISVYKGNSTTQSTAGITDTEDFDSLTGIHHVRIDLSADAFYATGNDYMVVLSAATIDGQTVNAVLAMFSIQNRYMRGTDGANTTAPDSAAAIRAEIDSNSTKLDVAVSTRLASASYTAPDSAAAIRAEIDANSTQLAAIVADTNELQTDNVPGLLTTLEGNIRGVDSDTLKTLSDQIDGVGGGGGDATEAKQDTIIAYVDSLETRLTDTRAGYLDSVPDIESQVNTLASRLTATRAGYLDNLTYLDAAISSIPGAAAGAIEVTDLVIDDGSNPIEGAEVWITTDSGGSSQVWYGVTNAAGVPKDVGDNNPWLDAGTYYVWVQKVNYSFSNPTAKVVS